MNNVLKEPMNTHYFNNRMLDWPRHPWYMVLGRKISGTCGLKPSGSGWTTLTKKTILTMDFNGLVGHSLTMCVHGYILLSLITFRLLQSVWEFNSPLFKKFLLPPVTSALICLATLLPPAMYSLHFSHNLLLECILLVLLWNLHASY